MKDRSKTSLKTDKNQRKLHSTGPHRFRAVFSGPSTDRNRSRSRSCQIWTKDRTGPDFQALPAAEIPSVDASCGGSLKMYI